MSHNPTPANSASHVESFKSSFIFVMRLVSHPPTLPYVVVSPPQTAVTAVFRALLSAGWKKPSPLQSTAAQSDGLAIVSRRWRAAGAGRFDGVSWVTQTERACKRGSPVWMDGVLLLCLCIHWLATHRPPDPRWSWWSPSSSAARWRALSLWVGGERGCKVKAGDGT